MRKLPTGTVTLLFTDIEGSTLLLQQLGKHYADILASCRQLLRSIFQQWNGFEVDSKGDSFFVAFAFATNATSAAAAAQRALGSYPWPEGVVVRIRMGLHTGEPQLSTEGYVGLDVHRAARIMSAGHGGQVLLSQTTYALVEQSLPEGLSLLDLGAHRLKDLQLPSHLFQLVIAGLPAVFPPLRTLDAYPINLPIQPTPLIGREKEVAALGALLRREDVHLVTLTGPGGTGKTRLGLQVAAELIDSFANGVFFVNLAPLNDPQLVIPTIAQALDINEREDQSLLDLLKASLREKHLLLLLDNFEQVVQAAQSVAELLAACPQLKIIVTSRMVLHVRAEHEFAVPPLALPDPKRLPDLAVLLQYEAIALFIQCARALKPDYQVTQSTAPVLAEICVRLDGLPLAIELAATRIKIFPPRALLARLSQRLTVLTSGARDAPTRQQTLRDTIAWSYQLLDIHEQRLFRRLSVFVGGCTLQAVEFISVTLGDTMPSMLDGVASLIDKSLLRQEEQAGGEARFSMLETLREFGLERLASEEETEATRTAHALYYLAQAEQTQMALNRTAQAEQLIWLEQEHENLRIAFSWFLELAQARGQEEKTQAERAFRLCAALYWFWKKRGYLREGRVFLEQALAGHFEVAALVRAKALYQTAELAGQQGDVPRTNELLKECLVLCQELGDKTGMAHCLHYLGRAAWVASLYATSRVQMEEAMALFQEMGNTRGRANCLLYLARISTTLGEYSRASTLLEEGLGLFRALGDQARVGLTLCLQARAVFLSQSDPARAIALAEQSQALLKAGGEQWVILHLLGLMGRMRLMQGQVAEARTLLDENVAAFKELGDRWGTAESLISLARVIAAQGDLTMARHLYKESLTLLVEASYGFKEFIAADLEGLGIVLGAQGALEEAVQLWGAADALRKEIKAPLPPVERAGYEQALAIARRQLTEKSFSAAWAEGQRMSIEQAIEWIFSISEPYAHAKVQPTPSYPAGLTTREVEVLRLVAQGMTNEQVAEQLVVSPRTVSTHLTSIYNKLGVNSRSAATRFAVEHQLI